MWSSIKDLLKNLCRLKHATAFIVTLIYVYKGGIPLQKYYTRRIDYGKLRTYYI